MRRWWIISHFGDRENGKEKKVDRSLLLSKSIRSEQTVRQAKDENQIKEEPKTENDEGDLQSIIGLGGLEIRKFMITGLASLSAIV